MHITQIGAGLAALGLTIAICVGPAQPHTIFTSKGLIGSALAIKGKTCMSKAGAKFTFGMDGRYAYDGLWQSSGSYSLHANTITVTFDSGLRRTFAMTVRDGVLHLEQTALVCVAG